MRSASAAMRCARTSVRPPINVTFEKQVNYAGVEQPACTLCGDCCSGCNVGSKNTVQVTYLADAFHHGAEIFTEMRVSHVRQERGALAGVLRAAGARAREVRRRRPVDHGRRRRAGRRHARLDRDPAALARRRPARFGPGRRALHRQRRRARLRLQQRRAGQRHRRRRAAGRRDGTRWARASPA